MKGKVKSYADIKVGDEVRSKVVHMVAKGLKQQWSDDLTHSRQGMSQWGIFSEWCFVS